uniref:Uncharacterized protein n=1 Tax=Sphaerodactylus townsendi TaxID=933632 RepID=A0ACB8FBL0_9SAUR
MWQEIDFLRRNMELLLACAEAAERDRQDPPQLQLLQPPKEERLVPALPNDELPGQPGPLGPSRSQQPQTPKRLWRVKARFDGTMEKLAYFLVQVEVHMEKHSGDYEDEVEQKSDSLMVPASIAVTTRMIPGPGKKSPFKKGAGLQVASHEASSASEEAGGPESSEESAGNDSDLA